ncbi:MAG: dihydroorotate dehydrogenase-like protein [Deltaproteobacteria bacterium]|nr:dihydroorotate dehydrogenase-like protein [Deltaproteobacteria bacterium]
MSVDLKTRYLGMELKNPLIAGPTPLTGHVDKLKELEEAGVAAVCLPSLFEEQIHHDEAEAAKLAEQAEGFAEAASFFPEMQIYNTGPDKYLETVKEAKAALKIPVFASLNGYTAGGWVRYAKMMQDAGADALELNVYDVPTQVDASAADIESRCLKLVSNVKEAISIPLAVKISPFFSSLVNMSKSLKEAGADGLICFNRFMQPDINLDEMKIEPSIELSQSAELRLPLRWIGILKGRVELSLGGTCGVHTNNDVVKLLLAGSDAVMLASSILRHGTGYPSMLLASLSDWMEKNDYASIEQLKGSMSQLNSAEPEKYERANYMKALVNYTTTNK